ncbi:MAG: acyl-CoA/acyl-ACP dehydrogenase [Solirubrobacterales bacterium]|nr:acyl-CoA/acyl-ACP dehydrogenase [Solirubrobacterales bacterium]
MNFALSDEQVMLREAARSALSRVDTIAGARAALTDPAALPGLWPTVVEAGWAGLLVDEDHGGAGLGGLEALLVAEECGRVLAATSLLGLLPAVAILVAAGDEALEAIADGRLRPAVVPARPPDGRVGAWTVDPVSGHARAPAPRAVVQGRSVALSGTVAHVPDAPGADLLVAIGVDGDGRPVAAALPTGSDGVKLEPVVRYDPTRSLAHVHLEGARGRHLDVCPTTLENAWYLGHAVIAAEALGGVQACLEMSVAYARERFTFGRPIGSYQSIKHELTEVLRLQENARGLQYYSGWALESQPDEFALAASAARAAAGTAFDFATRSAINVHGGIGATWEHDAPLFFRRAQLSRRLLGGSGDATDRVADLILSSAA